MQNNTQFIQDISLLYELSLSIGRSLDPKENCYQFLHTLISRKSLNFGAVWLHRFEEGGSLFCDLFFIHPHFRELKQSVSCNHLIVQQLASKPYISLSSDDPNFEMVLHEKNVGKGAYAIFKLGDLGFLKLFASNRPNGFAEHELEQLKEVVDKLKISLDGCFAHVQLQQETENRIKAQQALQKSENSLRKIIDSSLDAVVSVNDEGQVMEWNLQAEKMFGYSRQEALGCSIKTLIFPQKNWEIFDVYHKQNIELHEGVIQTKRFEGKCIRRSGEVFPVEISTTVEKYGMGNLYVGFIRDFTEQQKAQTEINLGHVRLKNLITNLHSGILLEDVNRKVVLVNQVFCDMLNLPIKPESMVGLDCREAAEQAKSQFLDPAFFISITEKAIRERKFVESTEFLMANGKVFERDYIPLFTGGSYDGHLWQYRDITERRNAEIILRASEEKYRGILENMELGLVEVDLLENIVRVNQAFCQMLGYSQDELIGKNTMDLLLPEDSKKMIKQRGIEVQAGQSSVYEIQLKKKNGDLIWGLVSGAPIKNAKGEIVGSLGIQFDLTDRKNLEYALAQAKLMAERARAAERQFLAHMSHEIRTPINAVIGMTHLLSETNPTTTQMEYLNALRFSADSLLGIIDNILDLSKIDAGEIELEERAFDLGYLIRSLVQAFYFKSEEKGIKIFENFDAGIDNQVMGDPTRVNQILTNLLGNSIKFTDKGHITIDVKLIEKSNESYFIEFKLSDTGIGIQEDKFETIFEYFKQADPQINRKFGGTGLGLTIVKQLVEMLGGSIRVESTYGVGSQFVFTLRLKNSGIPVKTPSTLPDFDSESQTQSIKGLCFLIVEDNHLNQMLLRKTFDSWGCKYEIANNGIEALLKTNEMRFDAILMDIHMPGIDGFETTAAIRQDDRNLNQHSPIIALTAAAMMEDKKKAFEMGMNGFLTKPISPKKLHEHLLHSINAPFVSEQTGDAPIAPRFDLSYLISLSQGDRMFVLNMVETFLEQTPITLTNLEDALQKNDAAQVAKLLHTLKPNFEIMGMLVLYQQTKSFEQLVKVGHLPLSQLENSISHLIGQIRAELTNMAAMAKEWQ
jgi:PAS domain S-box-containing protein